MYRKSGTQNSITYQCRHVAPALDMTALDFTTQRNHFVHLLNKTNLPNTLKIITVIGARPQFIKAAMVSQAFAANGIAEMLIHTGQHFDKQMSDVFFDELDIPVPAYNLGIHGSSHGEMTGRMLEGIEKILIAEKPDYVLVYGDTNSTFAGALAAAKLHIPVAHVEAGLRSFNNKMPEEINRIMTDHISTWLFAPNTNAVEQLHKEGINSEKIKNVGDVMYDAALYFSQKAEKKSTILFKINQNPKNYILATIHRAENSDSPERMHSIFSALNEIADTMPVILPIHPRTKKRIEELHIHTGKIKIIEPVGYLDMVMLEKHAAMIITDSGGVQKEAFFYRVPCLTLRSETEWTELVELGWNTLANPISKSAITTAFHACLHKKGRESMPYGDGHSAQLIANHFINVKN